MNDWPASQHPVDGSSYQPWLRPQPQVRQPRRRALYVLLGCAVILLAGGAGVYSVLTFWPDSADSDEEVAYETLTLTPQINQQRAEWMTAVCGPGGPWPVTTTPFGRPASRSQTVCSTDFLPEDGRVSFEMTEWDSEADARTRYARDQLVEYFAWKPQADGFFTFTASRPDPKVLEPLIEFGFTIEPI